MESLWEAVSICVEYPTFAFKIFFWSTLLYIVYIWNKIKILLMSHY